MPPGIVGDPILFRGMVYGPTNEQGVVLLFGKISNDLGICIERVRTGFPDCEAVRYTGRGWERVRIEFEYKSSDFNAHRHNPQGCDMIVCWEHDWKDIGDSVDTKHIEVIELSTPIQELPNETVVVPDRLSTDVKLKKLLENVSPKVGDLYRRFHDRFREVDDRAVCKVSETIVSWYSPQRVFLTCYFLQKAVRLQMFTGGKSLNGLSNKHPNWGDFYARGPADLDRAVQAASRSLELMRSALEQGLDTTWAATTPAFEATMLQGEGG